MLDRTGIDLDGRHRAVRDAVWSVAVQHGRAARILSAAVDMADAGSSRAACDYDLRLLREIHAERSAYVLRVAERTPLAAERATLQSIVDRRYPDELARALAMLDTPVLA